MDSAPTYVQKENPVHQPVKQPYNSPVQVRLPGEAASGQAEQTLASLLAAQLHAQQVFAIGLTAEKRHERQG